MAATVAMAAVCAHSLINRCHSPNTSPMQARINSSIHSHSVTAATVVSSNTADMVVATVVCRTDTNHNNTVVTVDTANSTANSMDSNTVAAVTDSNTVVAVTVSSMAAVTDNNRVNNTAVDTANNTAVDTVTRTIIRVMVARIRLYR